MHLQIIQGKKLDPIINKYNLGKANTFKINKFGQDTNYKTFNDLPKDLIKNVFLVSDEELNTYYENNIKDFVLPFDLVKALYAKIPVDAPDIGTFRKIIKEYPDSDINEIRSYCFQFAEKSFLEDTIWVKLDEIILNNPLLLINDKSQFLKRNTYVENVDENYYFFLKILDKRLIGETSPLSFEYNVINAIILNKRKQKLFDKLRDSIFVNSKKGIDYEMF